MAYCQIDRLCGRRQRTAPESTRIIVQDDYLVTIAMTLKTHVARNQSAWLSESIQTNSITSSRPLSNVLNPPIKAAAFAGEVLKQHNRIRPSLIFTRSHITPRF